MTVGNPRKSEWTISRTRGPESKALRRLLGMTISDILSRIERRGRYILKISPDLGWLLGIDKE